MITFQFNGETIKISANQSLVEFLAENGHAHQCFSVALNRQFVPRALYARVFIKENDVIDIIIPMQGG